MSSFFGKLLKINKEFNIKKFLLILFNLVFIYPILLTINLFIPFLHKFKPKYKRINLSKDATTQNIKSFQYYIEKYGIDKYHHNDFEEVIDDLIKKETIYLENKKTKELSFERLTYLFYLIDLSKEAIEKLENVSKDNRSIAYYEQGKNSNLDNLVEEYTTQLEEQGYKKLLLTSSRKEIKLKRLLAKFKREKSLFFNFYLLLFSFNLIEELKIKKKDKDVLELLINLYEFYRLGHATAPQIYKSLSIQIYELYKNDFEEKELEIIISTLITACHNLDKTYTNFNNIGKQEVYLKNLVYNFPLFECDTKLAKEQNELIFRFFTTTKNLFPKIIPLFFKKKFVNIFFKNTLDFYYKMDFLNFFGFAPRKK